jgi:hypothetical protein
MVNDDPESSRFFFLKKNISILPQHCFSTFSPSTSGKQRHPIIVFDPQHSRLCPLSFGVEAISKHIHTLLRLVKTNGRSLKSRAVGPTAAFSANDILAQSSWSCRQIFATLYRLFRNTLSNFTLLVLITSLQS